MDWQAALIVGLGLPALATLLGLAWRARTGRIRQVTPADATGSAVASPADAAAMLRTAREDSATVLGIGEADLGTSATLVQFSTEYCSRCPATARRLGEIADDHEGVRHVEIDLTRRPDLANRFDVRQTPTVLILAADGTSTARIGGVPRFDALLAHLETLTRRHHVAS